MATVTEPFSYVVAEISQEYIRKFPHPDIVPKYLETVSDKTGVEILTGISNTCIGIKGSWVSLSRAHSFLGEFFTTFRNAEHYENTVQSVETDSFNTTRSSKHKRRSLSDDDGDNVDCEQFSDGAVASEFSEKSSGDEVSHWLKWTAEVLPQIQRTRSKRANVYSEPKASTQKVPEPFVLYANFQPPSDPTAKKLPPLDDIERVLKQVYEKDRFAASAKALQDKLAQDHDENSSTETQKTHLQCSAVEKQTADQQIINHHDNVQAGSTCSPSKVSGACQRDSATGDSPSAGVASDLQQQHSPNSDTEGATFMTAAEKRTDDSAYIPTSQSVNLVGDHTQPDGEDAGCKQTSQIGSVREADVQLSDTPVQEAHANEENLISSVPEKETKTDGSLNRASRRKGRPRKKEKHKDKKKDEQIMVDPKSVRKPVSDPVSARKPVSDLKSARAERAAKRKAKTELALESDVDPEIKKKVKSKSSSKLDRVTAKGKRGRPPQSKSDTIEEKDYTCSECSYVAKKHSHLREHKRRVHITKEFKCDKCGKVFGFGKDLKRHRKTHQRAENCCDICGKMYKGFRSLAEHKKTHDDGYIKPTFPCEFCEKIFSTKYVLAYHIKSEHLGMKKTYICPTCGKSFSQKNSYLQHANVHMGIRPHQCDVCGKSFSYEKSLKEHKYMHDENKQFECPVCHKKFRQTSGVSIHMKIHKERKDYVCSACGKGFSQKQALVRHERIHDGEKPFTCGLCQRTFTDSSILRRHMILIHKKDPKKWREDTISNVTRRTDFFISVVGENGEGGSSDNPVKGKEDQTLPNKPASNIIDDNANQENKSEEDSFSFVPVGIGTSALHIPISNTQAHAEAMQMVFPEGVDLSAAGCVPPDTTSSRSQPLSSLQRAGSEEPSLSLPISFGPLASPSSQPQLVSETPQPLDMSAQGQMSVQGHGQMSEQGHGQLHAQSPGLMTPFNYGDHHHHRLSASDFYTSDIVQLQAQYAILNPTVSVTGTFHPPVMMSDTLNTHAQNFQGAPVAVSVASATVAQPGGFEELTTHPSVHESAYSPHASQ